MEAEEMLKELAAMEVDGSPAFPMLRIRCACYCHMIKPGQHDIGACVMRGSGESACPGWRAKSLDEARLCLEELLVAHVKQIGDMSANMIVAMTKAILAGKSCTEVVIAALHEASKVKV